ncbi:SCO family protein [Alkalicoccus luteus]|uniref:SCO family protein n=1 Tax=Alkalicoccus luteus TaxID=1237094 RepID=UPI0031B5AB28
MLKQFSVMLGVLLLSGCSFLYEDASESAQGEAVIDTTAADEPWMTGEFEAVNQHGEDVTSADLEGEWWLAKTIFTRCPTVCNVMSPNMAELQQEMEEAGVEARIVSFTVDPEFDTPEQLESYGESYGADFDSWDFLTGYEREDIQTYALDSFKAQVQEIPEQNDIMHPIRFFFVNPEGQVVRMYAGEDSFDAEVTVEDMQSVMEEN